MSDPITTGEIEAEASLEGGCLCGAVRYRASGTPRNVTHCHCSTCRRASGAPFVTWATVPAEGFRFTRGTPSRFRSSARATRTFCAECGTPLTYRPLAEPNEVDLTVCSLDRPDEITPEGHIFTRHRLPWIALADGLREYDEEWNRPPGVE